MVRQSVVRNAFTSECDKQHGGCAQTIAARGVRVGVGGARTTYVVALSVDAPLGNGVRQFVCLRQWQARRDGLYCYRMT